MKPIRHTDVPRQPEWREANYKDIVRDQQDFIEHLPLPYVTYPGVYGTWLSFRQRPDSEPVFCECQRSAMVNFLRMNQETRRYRLRDGDSLLLHFVASSAARTMPAIHSAEELRASECFRPSLCHKCNLKVPSVRWSNHPSHSVFMQHFGWYVSQAFLAYGIDWYSPFLRDQCPEDLLDLLDPDPWLTQKELADCAKRHGYRIFPMARLPEEFRRDPDEFRQITESLEALRSVKRNVESDIEHRLRRHFGFPDHGATGNHETILYLIARAIYSDHEVIRHARPSFLGGLTLDIYVPALRLGIEYQGLQHFKPMRHLGGEKQFKEVVERDRRKKQLCEDAGVALVYFDRSDKLTEEYAENKISQQVGAPNP